MKYLLTKDKKKRVLFKKRELLHLIFKYILFNKHIKKNIKEYLNFCFNMTKPRISKTLLRNRCIHTNRVRFLFLKYKISRLEFRRLAVTGNIAGVYRGTW